MTAYAFLRPLDALLSRLPLGAVRVGAFRRSAAAMLAAHDYDAADLLLARALRVAPHDAMLLFSHALSANNRGLFAPALARWEKALEAAPDNVLCWCGVAASLRALDAHDRARTAIEAALDRFPSDSCVRAEAARIATVRCELEAALGYWEDALALCDPHPDWFFGRADTLMKMRRLDDVATALDVLRARAPEHHGLAILDRELRQAWLFAIDDLPVPRPEAPEPGTTPIAPDALFGKFESLGDNCEFGLIQRYNHIEPLGLFRFSAATPEGLTTLFARHFADCGTADDLEVLVNATDSSYDCRSIAYADFRYHTESFSCEIEPGPLLQREVKKVAYLKKRFMSDLATAEKIFVRKGGKLAHNMAMFAAMRSYGPVTLLWIEEADERHAPGTVERLEDGLLKGYIGRFAPYGNAHDIDMVGWAELCCKALSLASGRPPYAPECNIVHRMGLRLAMAETCEAGDVTEPYFPQGRTQRLVLKADTTRDKALVAARYIDHELGQRARAVFSLWVWIPQSFKGTFVDVCFTNTNMGFVSQADLGRRDSWQRIWTSTRLPKTQTNAAVALRVTGLAGDTIFIGAWRLEAGSLPNPWPLDAQVGSRAAA